MVRFVAIVSILAQTLLLMFLVQSCFAVRSDQQFSSIVHLERKADLLIQHTNKVEAEPPRANVDQPHSTIEGEEEGGFEAVAPASRRVGKHKGTDPSVAGGGVILGGLALAVLAAVFSYIRVTRKRTNVTV